MSDDRFVDHYDQIYSLKDYEAEASDVIALFKKVHQRFPARILDVGCGTGGHAWVFHRLGAEVVGMDTDPRAIERAAAKGRKNSHGPEFRYGPLAELDEGGFDLAVALFNVVNYVPTLDELVGMFRDIHRRLRKDGALVLDCWNGLAALLDPPRAETREVTVDGGLYCMVLTPELDLMAQSVRMSYDVTVNIDGTITDNFDHVYTQTLWTPKILTDSLAMAGFAPPTVIPWANPGMVAGPDDWKLRIIAVPVG